VAYYDVKDNSWNSLTVTGNTPSPRRWHATTIIPNSARVMVSGGYNGSPLNDFYQLDLGTS